MNKTLIIITGPPGSGKTTVGKLLSEEFDKTVNLEIDWFWQIIIKGRVDPWKKHAKEQNEIVMDAASKAAEAYLNGGYLVIVDGIIGPWFLKKWQFEADIFYFILLPTAHTALQRAKQRDKESIDSSGVRHMWKKFQDLGDYQKFVLDNDNHEPSETTSMIKGLVNSRSQQHLLD